jgi:hypothetical protein
MKQKFTLIAFLCFIPISTILAQSTDIYWVFFNSKSCNHFEPKDYFTPEALSFKIRHNIALDDHHDYPVDEEYVSTISSNCNELRGVSRWFNAVSIEATSQQIEIINTLPFVDSTQVIRTQLVTCSTPDYESPSIFQLLHAKKQLSIMDGIVFDTLKVTGLGVRILVIDGGFTHADVTAPLSHLYTNNKIIKTWDFVQNDENVYAHNTHGTHVLSNICGYLDSLKLGFATKANFLLARSETRSELAYEEDYWLFAMEWGHKNGAQIINSSLGYTNSRYFNEDMNGKTSLVSKAANIAAAKGILVINAMGNEGDGRWKYLSTPADADSALAIGGIDPTTEVRVDFSSVGPSWDKRLKPNVSAPAITIVSGKDSYEKAYGTSFATPLVTGFAACVWEMIPELSNMELFKLIEQSGSLYPYYDYAHGYGIPQAGYFLTFERKKPKKTFEHTCSDNTLTIKPIDFYSDFPHLYYHIKNKEGKIISYYLYELEDTTELSINLKDFKEGYSVQIFYNGYTEEINPAYE